MDEIQRLSPMIVSALPVMLARAPGGFARAEGPNVMALSGEPFADLNMMYVGGGLEPQRFFQEGVEFARSKHLPLLALFATEIAEAPGFSAAGTVPLMLLDGPVAPAGACEIERVRDLATVAAAGALQGGGFGLSPDVMTRLLEASFTGRDDPIVFIASRDGVAMSTVTITCHGDTAGVWTMATPPVHQRKGIGRALLTSVLSELRGEGVARFYLFATEAGFPLYESLGFRTIAGLKAFVSGASVQVHE